MISVVYEAERYRQLLAQLVKEGDTVVEIGPHRCLATESYIGKAGKAVLVDKGTDCASALSEYANRHENVFYVCGDARDFATISLVQKHSSGCDVFAVDLGGGRFPDTVFKVWATWSGVLKPRHSLIRCRGLAEFLKRGQVRDDSIPKDFADSGWLTEYGRATPYKMRGQLDEFHHWVDVGSAADEDD